ncbi:transcriptional regulator, AraC family [gut metagenome]|uniref:Transcriptional regulator, AraC family n=1 Tax=gut metagenome TaxID=749906 RepID=J9GQZ7_9ZZZZ
MEKELPHIDLPEDWLAGTDVSKELLNLYANYPVRLKCEICVLCAGGKVNAAVNLKQIEVVAGDFVVLPPGTIFQISRIEGDLSLYILGFSEQFLQREDRLKKVLDITYLAFDSPVTHLVSKGFELMLDYYHFLIRLYEFMDEKQRSMIGGGLFSNIQMGIAMVYRDATYEQGGLSKNEQLCRSFGQLVMRHFAQKRNVSWYAAQMGITHAYLCSVVKQVTGQTCMDIISSAVIMEIKSQLKLTNLPIQTISDSLNFANLSFFGKYFKRHVGMSPLEYRNSR